MYIATVEITARLHNMQHTLNKYKKKTKTKKTSNNNKTVGLHFHGVYNPCPAILQMLMVINFE